MSCNAKKDPNGTWRIQYRWTDWTGTKKKSQKRVLKTKKEAEEWYVICAGNEILDISREEKKILFCGFLI